MSREVDKLTTLCLKFNWIKCQPVFDFESFIVHVVQQKAFAAWLERAAATTAAPKIIDFINKHQIDIGFNASAEAERRKKRLSHYSVFANQLISLRRLGVVHGETHDDRGTGLFLLNSHAKQWQNAGHDELLTQLCAIAGDARAMWTTDHQKVIEEIERLDLRSVVSRDGGKRLAMLVGPLSWLNHSLRSGVVLTQSRAHLLQKKLKERSMLFEAVGYDDRREILIRYDSPDSATWNASVAQHAWYEDRKSRKRKR